METDTTNAVPPAPDAGGEEPKKYIRTFAEDMRALQAKSAAAPEASPVTVSAAPETPAPAPSVQAETPASETPVKQPELIVPAQPVSAPAPAPEIAPLPPKTAPVASPARGPSPVQTYAGDFSAYMKEQHASTATVLAAEQDAAAQAPVRPAAEAKSSSGGVWYAIAAAVLFIGGIGGAYVAYLLYMKGSAPVIIAPTASAPIFVDASEQIAGTGRLLQQAIEQSMGKPLAPNTVRELTLGSNASTTIFSALELNAPGMLMRNIAIQGSMAGIVNAGGTQSPFFLLAVNSYNTTFSAMLSWESYITVDLASLYPVPQAASATSTSATQKVGFVDEVVSNHDVRTYRDALGQSIITYGYWDQHTLIIARDPAAFAEILARLATASKK